MRQRRGVTTPVFLLPIAPIYIMRVASAVRSGWWCSLASGERVAPTYGCSNNMRALSAKYQ